MRTTYPTDPSDAEWGCLEPHLLAPKATGRPRVYPLREILNAIFYVVRSGCSWRLLPHDFPSWRSFYHYFREFRLDRTWERMHAALRERVRVRLERNLLSRCVLRGLSVESGPSGHYPTKGAPDGPNPAYPAPVFTLVPDQERNGGSRPRLRVAREPRRHRSLRLDPPLPRALAGQNKRLGVDPYHNAYHNWYHNQPEIHGAL
jgi:transposase